MSPCPTPVMAEAEEAETTDPATTGPEAVAVAADVESESPEVEVFAVDPEVTTAEPAAEQLGRGHRGLRRRAVRLSG